MNAESSGTVDTRRTKTVIVRKEIVPFEKEGPEEEPLFINHCQVARHQSDIYIDIGLVPLDDLVMPDRPEGVRFVVLNRLVMGVHTLRELGQQIQAMLRELESSGAAPSSPSQT